MTITEDKGTKSDDDKIIKYNDLPITILEIGKLLLKLWANEDIHHLKDSKERKCLKISLMNYLRKER